MSSEIAIFASQVKKSFRKNPRHKEKFPVLNNLSLSVTKSQSIAILGPNGAGKTTFMKALLGLVFPDSGQIQIFSHPAGSQMARQRLGFLSELPLILDFLSRQSFLNHFASLISDAGHSKDNTLDTLIQDLIGNIPIDLPMSSYSKGMMQRLNFARVLQKDPELIFLDEPATGLDPIGQLNIVRIVNRLRELGRTIYVNTHSIDFALEAADRVVVLHQGRIVTDQMCKDISRSELENLFLGLDSIRS
ncbi:MAG: ABC transporter ATP-binding protein [Candidatus Cloacimonetes bacterium]|nr:ABC transporter ATP-binding protein [Candidatus Cloacimonadota bacterium]